MIKDNITIENFIEIVVAGCIGCLFLADIFSSDRKIFIALSYILSMIIIIYDTKYLNVLGRKLILTGIALLTISMVNMVLIGNTTITFIIKFFLVDLSIALYFVGSKKLSKVVWYIIAMIFYLVIWYCMINSVDGYQLFSETSRNYASVYSLFILFILGIVHYKDNSRLPTVFIIHNMLLSVYSVGRGGIISAIVLVVLFLITKVKTTDEFIDKVKIVGLLLIASMGVLCYMYLTGLLSVIWDKYLWRFYDNRAVGSTEERILMIKLYFDKTNESIWYWLIGTDIRQLSLLQHHNWNIHNSFLMLHKAFGLVGSFLLLLGNFLCFKAMWNFRQFILCSILFTIMIRSVFDNCFPYHLFNIPFLFLAIGGVYKYVFDITNKLKEDF